MTTLIEGLIQFSGHPLVYALGWTLLHFLWQGSAVALMLGCVLGLLGGRSSQARYGAACLALGLMVALPAATFVHIAAAEYKARTAFLGSGAVLDASIVLQVSMDEPLPPWPARIGMALDHSLPWVLLAWFAGVIVFVGRLNFGLLVARRLKTAGTEAPSPALLRLFEQLRIRLGVERAVDLLHSARVQVPTVIGWLRPVVLLPVSCLTGLSPEQIEAVLCHELAHVRRHDYLVSVVQSVIETVLFYHPAVWWVSKQVRRERECCCDELAVNVGGDVLAYARSLSYLEESRASFPEFVLGANGGVLKMRIQRILGSKRNAQGSPAAALVALGLILAVTGSYFAAVSHAQAQAARAEIASAALPAGSVSATQEGTAAASDPAQTLHGIYKSWLNQDVLWIITPSERDAFLKLTNDEERDQFIKQFWQRRDPPGAAAGTYREEHYARIAYSNQHFASNGQPGWSRDRGHIYIVYGKPQSIDSHPGGDSVSAYPYEIWHYKYIAGIGDNVDLAFVDTCQCGDYHYTIDPSEKEARAAFPGPGPVKQESAQFDAMDAQISLAKKLLAPGGAGASQSATPSQYQYLMPGIQQKDGTIDHPTGMSWTIIDSHGAPVSGAKVTATNTDNGTRTTGTMDNLGTYSFSVPPGLYNVEVEAKGFVRTLQENVHVQAGQWSGWNLKLNAGAGAETPSLGAAQQPGSIFGTIVDPRGALVPRANVTAINTDDGVKTATQTDNKGSYSFAVLPPGPYLVEVEAKGFQNLLQENVHVAAGQTVGLNLKLSAGAQNPTAAAKSSSQPDMSCTYYDGGGRGHAGTCEADRANAGGYSCRADDDTRLVQAQISCEWKVKRLEDWRHDNPLPPQPRIVIAPSPDKELYDRGTNAIADGWYEQGRQVLQTLISTYPNSQYVARAKLAIADSLNKQKSAAPTIRSIDYKGLNSVTIQDVVSRFSQDAIGLALETPYDVTRTGRAAAALKQLLAEHGHPNATVTVSTQSIPPGAIGILFSVKEGPKAVSAGPVAKAASNPAPVAEAAAQAPTTPAEYDGVPLRKVGGGVIAPVAIQVSSPEYTKEAKKAKFKGIVLVGLIVDTNGMPQNVHVLRGVGMGLDEKAVEAVKRYKFKPAMEGDKPVPVEVNIEIQFEPGDSAELQAPGGNPAVADASAAPTLPDGATSPQLIYKVDPEFTEEARKAKASGIVLVTFVVDKHGMPEHVHVLRGVGNGLDEKAVEAVKQYKFKPAMKDNKPVQVALNVEVNFQIF